MRVVSPQVGLIHICSWFGVSRQAYYQHKKRQQIRGLEKHLVIEQVHKIRSRHPQMGGRKLYLLLTDFLQKHQIKMGRDALFDLLAAHHLLVKKRKRKARTTYSNHWLRKYPNLIKDIQLTGCDQLWVSDITYWKVQDHFVYVSLITDEYSHKIIGYQVAPTLATVESAKALIKALAQRGAKRTSSERPLIHHSDRGVQYCSEEYVQLLKSNGIKISMTENGDPLENPVAERVNGILKNEYLAHYEVQNLQQAEVLLAQAVELYNQERPHMSISNLTPQHVHQTNTKVQRNWKNYYVKKKLVVNPFQDENLRGDETTH